jgi:hypothetical protein
MHVNQEFTQDEMRRQNPENFNPIINGRMMRAPVRTIYIYSVARRDFEVRRKLFPKLTIRGCKEGERWVQCTSFGDPIVQMSPDQERGGVRPDEADGWRAAIDALNPSNLTNDPYMGSDNPNFFANTLQVNLIAEGVFPSLNDEPTEAELKRAERFRDNHYRYLTREATRLAAVSTKDLNEFIQQYPDVHTAMDALGLVAPWHTSNEVKSTCPNCGEPVKLGLAFHISGGRDCVIDWKAYWEAGRVKKEEVPPKYRWQGFGKLPETA